MPCDIRNRGHQFGRFHGLTSAPGTPPQGLEPVFRAREPGQRHRGKKPTVLRFPLPKPPDQRVAILVRQADVADQRVRLQRLAGPEALLEPTRQPSPSRRTARSRVSSACARRHCPRRPGCGDHRAAASGRGDFIGAADRRSTRPDARSTGGRREDGQTNGERGAFPRPGAVGAHGSPMQLDELAHDREPQTEPGVPPARGPVRLAEAIEHVGKEVGTDPLAGVVDCTSRSDPTRLMETSTRPFSGVNLTGVRQQVHDHLLEPAGIATHQLGRRRIGRELQLTCLVAASGLTASTAAWVTAARSTGWWTR